MIRFKQGDILKSDSEAIVNTVNCVGVMGRGIALQFKKAYPDNFREYKKICDRKELEPGRMLVHDTNRIIGSRYVINFPTKRHWRAKSRIEDVRLGLAALVREVEERGIRSIAIPPLGCGLGGLDWEVVRSMIEKAFIVIPDVEVLLFEPRGAPEAGKMIRPKKIPNMTKGRATLLMLMDHYFNVGMEPHFTLLELHKLMYFMQEAGEPLKLNYTKALYGPYATNLRHVLNVIEGHFISGYADGEDNPDKAISLLPEIVDKATKFLKDYPDTTNRLDNVIALIEGFETAYGMELLSTVHWIAAHESATDPSSAVQHVYGWNERKRQFPETHIRRTWEALSQRNWLPC